MRPTLLLDCDGILADYVGTALLILKQQSGISVPRDAVTSWEVSDHFPPEAEPYKPIVQQLIKGRLGCKSIRPYDGAKAGLAKIADLADIVIVTSPMAGSPTWMSEREEWLTTHFGIHSHDVIHAHKKFHVRGDIFCDDKTENVVHWAKAHPQGLALLWHARYNEKDAIPKYTVQRMRGWDELLTHVKLWITNSER
jgi:5'(3')-deoxyribonucleotidase